MTLLSGICQHCGKKKEEHPTKRETRRYQYVCSASMPHPSMVREMRDFEAKYGLVCSRYEDSGLARLHLHSQELFEAANKVCQLPKMATIITGKPEIRVPISEFEQLQSIIQKITAK